MLAVLLGNEATNELINTILLDFFKILCSCKINAKKTATHGEHKFNACSWLFRDKHFFLENNFFDNIVNFKEIKQTLKIVSFF